MEHWIFYPQPSIATTRNYPMYSFYHHRSQSALHFSGHSLTNCHGQLEVALAAGAIGKLVKCILRVPHMEAVSLYSFTELVNCFLFPASCQPPHPELFSKTSALVAEQTFACRVVAQPSLFACPAAMARVSCLLPPEALPHLKS